MKHIVGRVVVWLSLIAITGSSVNAQQAAAPAAPASPSKFEQLTTGTKKVEGLWTVKRDPAEPADAIRFVVTDTWVRRHGQWQVVWRYSHRLPGAPWPPLAPKE